MPLLSTDRVYFKFVMGLGMRDVHFWSGDSFKICGPRNYGSQPREEKNEALSMTVLQNISLVMHSKSSNRRGKSKHTKKKTVGLLSALSL